MLNLLFAEQNCNAPGQESTCKVLLLAIFSRIPAQQNQTLSLEGKDYLFFNLLHHIAKLQSMTFFHFSALFLKTNMLKCEARLKNVQEAKPPNRADEICFEIMGSVVVVPFLEPLQ